MDVARLTPRIREILQNSDLSTVSAKKVRRQLENEMNTSFDSNKAEVDDVIKQQFQVLHNESQQRHHAQQQYVQQYAQQGPMGGTFGVGSALGGAAADAAGGAADAPPRKRGRPRKPENEKKQPRKKRVVDPDRPPRQTGLSKPMKLSAALGEFLGQKFCARTEVVKNLWKYIKERELQDPSDKRYILCDARLRALFDTERLFMYTMNKLLNDHLFKPTPEESAEIGASAPPTHLDDGVGSATPMSAGSEAPHTPHSGDDGGDDGDGDNDAKPDVKPLELPPQPSALNNGTSSTNPA
ncbi:hypothetical protein IWQ56_003127 [Coemansia nantahalensis]|uniref:Uncharacterized protein n=1 Tax=Coemansia helicoidea TaxID=1286919 RepID=A0ACC1LCV2_9FUNG|nr:hypothetical protein IWQ56_003127 [Coemansia nantahalensis]KAJ2805862.1 hypothetical protein H4R21_001101 [Coemansia helicoidea]